MIQIQITCLRFGFLFWLVFQLVNQKWAFFPLIRSAQKTLANVKNETSVKSNC